MAQIAIAINVSGRVVCERRRCGAKKKAPVASKRMAGNERQKRGTSRDASPRRSCPAFRSIADLLIIYCFHAIRLNSVKLIFPFNPFF